jgi:hypothetical protein
VTLFLPACDRTADHLRREAAALQKANLLCLLGGINGSCAELLPPHLARAIEFAVAVVAQHRFDDGVVTPRWRRS